MVQKKWAWILLTLFFMRLLIPEAYALELGTKQEQTRIRKEKSLPTIRGVSFDPYNLDKLIFYVDSMHKQSVDAGEINQLIANFFGFLTVPQEKLWVNLSPHESDRIIPDVLMQFGIGKDMLIQDYMLKQLTCSLTNPKTPLGRRFWKDINQAIKRIARTHKMDINANYKIWIVPDQAEVYECESVGQDRDSELNPGCSLSLDGLQGGT